MRVAPLLGGGARRQCLRFGHAGGTIVAVGAVLSGRERAVLDFERCWWLEATAETKAEAIRRQLRISATRYYEILELLCDSAAARDYDPLVVHRLRRRRSERRQARLFGGPAPKRSGHR